MTTINIKAVLLAVGIIAISTTINAQTLLPIKDFSLYGKDAVQLSTSSSSTGGRIGSQSLIVAPGSANFKSNLHSGGRVEFGNSITVEGNISAANAGNLTSTIFLAGSNSAFTGRLDVKGNIAISGGSVNGPVVTSGSYSGPTPTTGPAQQNATPTLPVIPDMPAPLTAATYSNTQSGITTTVDIGPGSYSSMALTGNKTVTFRGAGDYVFGSIANSGNFNKFVFDFKGDVNAIFRIFVTGNVDLYKISIDFLNLPIAGGATTADVASRILMQVGGTGNAQTGFAWAITNGASGNNQSTWLGTVIALNGNISVGAGSSQSKIIGSLWSGKTVYVNSGVSITYAAMLCVASVANAGADKTFTCPIETSTTIGTATSQGLEYKWTTIIDGVPTVVGNTKTITVTRGGTYTLTVKNSCDQISTDEVVVTYISCVNPINNTPGGKVYNLIGAELTNLPTNLEEARKYLVLFGNDSVLIEVVAKIGSEQAARDTMYKYGMRSEIPNGINPQLITGTFPIANLLLLNAAGPAEVINHVRPVFIPLGNVGITTSAGDTSIKANLARNGFNTAGEGVKIGVISDSYNTKGKAGEDIGSWDLPGHANHPFGNTTPVEVVLEFPWGQRSDEGRAMLQIVHDLAPKSPLSFRTGFRSAGDFAAGILELKDAGCKVIVDDVTYITEPFFKDGIVSKAVDMVTAQNVIYFTSAGNFGSKSYTSNFNPVNPLAAVQAHNFGGGDTLQKLLLKPGQYTIVLQWSDEIYSLGAATGTFTGTQNDLDIYLVDRAGKFGFNRPNLYGDPIEILSFSIFNPTNPADTSLVIEADLLIVKAASLAGAANPKFKYIIFRGNATIAEYYAAQSQLNKSTIVGQANSENAVSIGAVLWSNTPPFGVGAPTIASFSSTGGTPIYNGGNFSLRNKPDLTAPNGVNTTVQMGPDNDGSGRSDGFSNFYGTSAAAPHAAAAAALVQSARKKFYDTFFTQASLKDLLLTTAYAMQPDGIIGGVNYKAGRGLVQPYEAIRTFANPKPYIKELLYANNILPGTTTFTVTIPGKYYIPTSEIYVNGQAISTTVNATLDTVRGTVPLFLDNPPVYVVNPPFTPTSRDGGSSDSLYFFSHRDIVKIIPDNKQKRYGESLPALTTTILVNGDSLHVYNSKHNKNLTREDLGVANLNVYYTNTTLNAFSDVGRYLIRASRTFTTGEADIALQKKYIYDSTANGILTINRLPVTIAPRDTTVTYGNALGNFNFNYILPADVQPADAAIILNNISTAHQTQIDNTVIALGNGVPVAVVNGVPVAVVNKIINGVPVAVVNGVPVAVVNGVPVAVVNGVPVAIVNSQSIEIVNGNPVVVADHLANGVPVAVVNGVPVAVVNGVPVAVVNTISNGVPVAVVNGVPIAYVNTFSTEQVSQKGFMATTAAIQNAREIVNIVVAGGVTSTATTRVVDLTNQSLLNFNINPDGSTATLTNSISQVNSRGLLNLNELVNGVPVAVVNGVPVAVVNGVPVAVVNGVPVSVVNGVPVAVVNGGAKIPVIIDSVDAADGIRNMKSVNFITGITAGIHSIVPGALLSDNLEISYLPATITILPAPLSVKAADATKTYGEYITLDTTKFSVTSGTLMNGESIVAVQQVSAGTATTSAVGTYDIDASNAAGGEGTDMSNYVVTYQKGLLTVGKATITVSADASSKTYGSVDPPLTYKITSGALVAGDAFSGTLQRDAGENVGTYPIRQGTLTAGGNYSITYAGANFNINKALLTITADASSKTYGSVDPPLTYKITSGALVAGNTLTGTLQRDAGENVGTYLIRQGTLTAGGNYSITYAGANFNINKALLTVTADNKMKQFGAANPAFTASYSGFVRGDVITGSVSGSAAFSTTATDASVPGTYTITVSQGTLAASNYDFRFVNGVLTITEITTCLLTHSKFTSFASTTVAPTSLWLNIEIKVSGQLSTAGDYIMFSGGSITFNNITSKPAVTDFAVKRGVIIADARVQAPVTFFDQVNDLFVTKVPVGFSSSSDIFISGAIINSEEGFIKRNNGNSILKGIFYSNKNFSDQWNYAMAAYQKSGGYVQYADLKDSGSVVSVNGDYRSGTPIKWLSYLVPGGSGNGGNSYTGSSSSNDNFTACLAGGRMLSLRVAREPIVEVKLPNQFEAYPNPATSEVNVAFVTSATSATSLTLYSINGAKVMQVYIGITDAGKLYRRRINTEKLPVGLYVLELQQNGEKAVKKIVISNH